MLDAAEQLDEMQRLDERNIHANRFFQALRQDSVRGDFPEKYFPSVLLYFVARLILDAPKAPRNDAERVFIRTDIASLIDRMVVLIKHCSDDATYSAELAAALNVDFVTRLFDQFDYLEPAVARQHGFARRVFDVMLRRILSEQHNISLYHAHVVASLVVSLSKVNATIIEAFPCSGAMQVTAKVLKKDVATYHWEQYGYPYAHQDLIRLRLELRGLSHDAMPVEHDEFEAQDMTVIDGGQRSKPERFPTVETLRDLIKRDDLSGLTLIVLDREDDRNLPDDVRDFIARHDLLEAVIDLPSLDRWENQTAFTAWLLNTRKTNPNETLLIDATHLTDASNFEATWFAAAVVERWRLPNHKISSKLFKQVLNSSLEGLFLNYLEGDYKDIRGVCKSARTTALLRSRRLTAQEFVGQEGLKSAPKRLKSDALSEVLRPETGPTCSYVIGNNGAGKSLLLRSLIDELSQQRITSVGIAFGPRDRFPTEDRDDCFFIYEGARTLVDPRIFLADLCQRLFDIYQSQPNLQMLTRVIEMLSVHHPRLLMPIKEVRSALTQLDQAIATHDLAYDSSRFSTQGYEPGVVGKGETEMTPFSDLSSGEQQILSLMIRVCATADRHKVFLIDEPEISLHVRWQQQLPGLLSIIAKEFECSFVVATHSPIIVANASDEISHCFLAKDQRLTPIAPHQRHSVESILLDGFDTYPPDTGEINERCAVLVSRAIRATNQPGRVDPALHKALDKSLDDLKKKMKQSPGGKDSQHFTQDIKLIEQAKAAINELFERATTRTRR
ncbi:AAA family ATPase [Pseudomonas sp. RIT-To-2]|uniref:AAA family ATPase n=1 Tax=Pseudomonas sp. RIT-To-2 TaxID=3462541 RepID=UPI00241323CC